MVYPNQDGFLPVLERLLFEFHLLKDIITDSRSRHLPEKLCKGQSRVPSESSCFTSEPHRIAPGLFVLNQVSSIFRSIPFKFLSVLSLTQDKACRKHNDIKEWKLKGTRYWKSDRSSRACTLFTW